MSSSGRSQSEIARERVESLVAVLPKRRGVVALAFRAGEEIMGEVEINSPDDPLGALSSAMVRWATVQGRRIDAQIVGMNEKGEVVWRGNIPVRPEEEEAPSSSMDNGANLFELVKVLANANLALMKQNVETVAAVSNVLKAHGASTSALMEAATDAVRAATQRATEADTRAHEADTRVREASQLVADNQLIASTAMDASEKAKGEMEGLVGDALKQIVGTVAGSVVSAVQGAGSGSGS